MLTGIRFYSRSLFILMLHIITKYPFMFCSFTCFFQVEERLRVSVCDKTKQEVDSLLQHQQTSPQQVQQQKQMQNMQNMQV